MSLTGNGWRCAIAAYRCAIATSRSRSCSRCLEGRVEVELTCEPVFDYGHAPAKWSAVDGERHAADASGAGQTIRLYSDLALGIEGSRVRARHFLERGDRAYRALSVSEGASVVLTDIDTAAGEVLAPRLRKEIKRMSSLPTG